MLLADNRFYILATKGEVAMAQQTPVSKKATTAKQGAARSAAKGATARSQAEGGLEQEERHRMITEAAYLIAEQRGFQGDMALDDWLQAEAEVEAKFAARH
jgi:hypothetical protein